MTESKWTRLTCNGKIYEADDDALRTLAEGCLLSAGRDSAPGPAVTAFDGAWRGKSGRLRLAPSETSPETLERYKAALSHIATGGISPSIGFAKRILAGETVIDAHKAEAARMFPKDADGD
jgi:hypothetical protein